jgi:hypothetical protein
MLQALYERGALPPGVIEGLIVLLHKGSECNSLNNWRPIILLNVSYKLFAKNIASVKSARAMSTWLFHILFN